MNTGILADVLKYEDVETQYFLEEIANASPDIVYVLDLVDDKVLFVNDRVEEMLGLNKQAIYKRGRAAFVEITHPEDVVKRKDELNKCRELQGNDTLEIDYRVKGSNGKWRWFRMRDKAFKRNKAGEVTQVIGSARDITAHKRAEKKIAAHAHQVNVQREMLRAILDTVPHGIQVLQAIRNGDNEVIGFNYLMKNKVQDKLSVNHTSPDYYLNGSEPMQVESDFFPRMKEVVQTGESVTFTHHHWDNTFEQWLKITYSKFNDGIIAFTEDVSERMLAEEKVYEEKHFSEKVCLANIRAILLNHGARADMYTKDGTVTFSVDLNSKKQQEKKGE